MILVKPSRPLFLLVLLFLASSNLLAETNDQHIKVALRKIGHAFLLDLNDSTSRVLPIEKINGRYALRFERSFSFMPDVLGYLTWEFLSDAKLNVSYIVEVERCGTNQVVHSFEVSQAASDSSVACAGRTLPEDCYVFYFTVIENEESIEGTNQNSSSQIATKKTSSNYVYLFFVLAAGTAALLFLKAKKKNPKIQNPHLIQIGQFQFDQKRMILHSKSESTELSGKESELLLLLYSNENKTLEREFILKQVWQDTGEYIGRTLDVFISKLRKKLDADPGLKIINIRGVGYKFVISKE